MITTLKKFWALTWVFLFAAYVAYGQNGSGAELNITLGEQRIRFAPTRSFQEMRLEVLNQVGEIVFAHTTAEAEFNWNLRAGNGEVLVPGLYAYRLALKFSEDQTRQHAGHFVIEKSQDQLWLTTQDGAEVSGATFNATRTGGRSVAGLRAADDKAVKRDVEGREIVDEKGNKLADSAKATKQEKANILGTLNRVAKFGVSGLADTDSGIREDGSGRLGFNINSSATTPYLFNGDIVNPGASRPALILQSEADHARLEMRSAGAVGTHAPIVQGRAASGTLGAPGATPVNQIMGGFGGGGFDTANGYAQFSSGFIGINASQAWTPTAHGSYITFGTTADFSTTRFERMRITDDGRVGIGTANPNAMLQATGSALKGVYGVSTGVNGIGVHGSALVGATAIGVYGSSSSGTGVVGRTTALHGVGIQGEANVGAEAIGVYGSSASGTGVVGRSTALNGIGNYGEADNGQYSIGVYGKATTGFGVYGIADGVEGVGIRGVALLPATFAGRFLGDVFVNGILSKSGGSFKIDHPLDPAHKYLSHSFVESPDMMNIYNGNVTTDYLGNAEVTMPEWFEALNKDFRYQLTVIGQFAQAMVAEKMAGNRFKIKTSSPNVEVSWQVTGIRQDAWANQHRIPVEENKSGKENGYYLSPELFGQSEEKGTDWARDPEGMRKLRDKSRARAQNPAAGLPPTLKQPNQQ